MRAHPLDAHEETRATHGLLGCFYNLLRICSREHVAARRKAIQASNVPELRGIAASLQRDEDAVWAALTPDWNSGQVEVR
jgi:hypothetical protein